MNLSRDREKGAMTGSRWREAGGREGRNKMQHGAKSREFYLTESVR